MSDSTNKGIALRKEPRNSLEIVRRGLADSRNEFTDAVTAFSQYIDPLGSSATSPGGFVISVNRRLKSGFGDVELDALSMSLMTALYARLAKVVRDGIERGETRKSIKGAVSRAIERAIEAAHQEDDYV